MSQPPFKYASYDDCIRSFEDPDISTTVVAPYGYGYGYDITRMFVHGKVLDWNDYDRIVWISKGISSLGETYYTWEVLTGSARSDMIKELTAFVSNRHKPTPSKGAEEPLSKASAEKLAYCMLACILFMVVFAICAKLAYSA
jgi:hypothetical protein